MKLFIADADDYIGLYVDGRLVSWDDHYNFTLRDLGRYIKFPATIESIDIGCIDSDDMDFHPPDKLEDLKLNS